MLGAFFSQLAGAEPPMQLERSESPTSGSQDEARTMNPLKGLYVEAGAVGELRLQLQVKQEEHVSSGLCKGGLGRLASSLNHSVGPSWAPMRSKALC